MRAAPGAGPRRAQASRGRRPRERLSGARARTHPPRRGRAGAPRSALGAPAQFNCDQGNTVGGGRWRGVCGGGWDPAVARVADWARIKEVAWRCVPLDSRGTQPAQVTRKVRGWPSTSTSLGLLAAAHKMADRGRGDRGGFGRGFGDRGRGDRGRGDRGRDGRAAGGARAARRRREGVGAVHQARPPRQVGQDQVARADLPLLAPDQGVPDRRLLHEGQAQGRGDADRVGPEADVGGPAHALRLLGRRRRLRRARGPRREGGEGGAARHPRRHPRRQVQPRADPPRLLGRQDRPPPHRAHQADGPVRLRPHPPHPRRPRCAAAPPPPRDNARDNAGGSRDRPARSSLEPPTASPRAAPASPYRLASIVPSPRSPRLT